METAQQGRTAQARRLRRLWGMMAAVSVLLLIAIVARVWFKADANWLELEKESPRIGTIDFYGLRTVSEQQVRAKLNIQEGDAAPVDIGDLTTPMKIERWWLSGNRRVELRSAVEERLEQIPGVARAALEMVGDGSSKASLFVGIEERGAPHFSYRPVPGGSVVLPKNMTEAYDQMIQAIPAALASGADEDDSQGYALIKDPTMLPLEQKMIAFAASNTGLTREALKDSADAHQRTVAAWIIGYAPDKRVILGDLMDAVRDPDETVRNNATRALAVIAEFANQRPDLGIHIDPSRFIDMLRSLTWTDRNKATGVLNGLTEGRSPEILQLLRERALPPLTEMARWRDGHAQDALELLGRIAGLDEVEIQSAWDRGERERVIAMASAPTGR